MAYRILGKAFPRIEGYGKVTGKSQHQERRQQRGTKPKELPPRPTHCDWCGNLIEAHNRELLVSCRAHARQLRVFARGYNKAGQARRSA